MVHGDHQGYFCCLHQFYCHWHSEYSTSHLGHNLLVLRIVPSRWSQQVMCTCTASGLLFLPACSLHIYKNTFSFSMYIRNPRDTFAAPQESNYFWSGLRSISWKILYYIWHAAFTRWKGRKKNNKTVKKKKIFLGDVCQTAEIFKEFQWPQTWESG